MKENVLMIDDNAIKERTGLHTNIDPKLIFPDIKTAQDIFIQPLLGTNLFNKLLDLIYSNQISLDENALYKELLDNYVVDTLIYYTLSLLPQTLSYQITNKGILRKNDENASLPSMGELIDVANEYKNRGEFYGQRLIRHLKANMNLFPEYNTYNTSLDAINPINDNYSTGIWLDDDDNIRGPRLPYWPYKP